MIADCGLRIADLTNRLLSSRIADALRIDGVKSRFGKSAIRHPQSTIALLLALYLSAPEALLAAEGSGEGWGIWLTIGRLFNLALVIGVLVWIARKPLADFLAGRTRSIQEQLAQAQKARQEAEAKLAEVESKMSHLDEELQELKVTAEKEAQEEYRRQIAAAERDAEKIVERARQEIEGMTRAAQMELKAHTAELSVRLAEDRIRSEITNEDRGRLFARFVSELGGKK